MAMFQKAGVSVLGMVENMSHYACPSCGHRDDIFGSQGAVAAAADYGIQVLGEVRPSLTFFQVIAQCVVLWRSRIRLIQPSTWFPYTASTTMDPPAGEEGEGGGGGGWRRGGLGRVW